MHHHLTSCRWATATFTAQRHRTPLAQGPHNAIAENVVHAGRDSALCRAQLRRLFIHPASWCRGGKGGSQSRDCQESEKRGAARLETAAPSYHTALLPINFPSIPSSHLHSSHPTTTRLPPFFSRRRLFPTIFQNAFCSPPDRKNVPHRHHPRHSPRNHLGLCSARRPGPRRRQPATDPQQFRICGQQCAARRYREALGGNGSPGAGRVVDGPA